MRIYQDELGPEVRSRAYYEFSLDKWDIHWIRKVYRMRRFDKLTPELARAYCFMRAAQFVFVDRDRGYSGFVSLCSGWHDCKANRCSRES